MLRDKARNTMTNMGESKMKHPYFLLKMMKFHVFLCKNIHSTPYDVTLYHYNVLLSSISFFACD